MKSVNVGFNLVPSLLSGKVNAIVGGYQNVEALQIGQETGKPPNVLPLNKVGIPTYNELVLAANSTRLKNDPAYAAKVKKVVAGLVAGTKAALADPAARPPSSRRSATKDRSSTPRWTDLKLPVAGLQLEPDQ